MKFDIEKIKRKMIVKYPYFTGVILNLNYKENSKIKTTTTDGKTIYYNKDYLESLSIDEQLFIIMHQICHVAFNHILRSEGKDLSVWGQATDAVINANLIKDGLKPPKGIVEIENAIQYSSEELYEKLKELAKQNNQNNDQSNQSEDNKSDSNQMNSKGSSQSGDNKDESNNNQSQSQNNDSNSNGNQDKESSQSNSSAQGNDDQEGKEQNNKDSQNQDKENSQSNSSTQGNDNQEDKEQNNKDSQNQDSNQKGDSNEDQNKKNKESSSNDNDKKQEEKKSQSDSNQDTKENEEEKIDSHDIWKDAVEENKKEKEQDSKEQENKELHQNDNNPKEKEQDRSSQEKEKNNSNDQVTEKDVFDKNKEEKKKALQVLKDELQKSSRHAGTSPGEQIREVDTSGYSKELLDWRLVLREAVNHEVDWTTRNAVIEDGVICSQLEELPHPETEIVLDTSGSISHTLLRNFLKECKNILQHSKIKVGCFDTKFYGFEEIRRIEDIEKMEFKGGGGTSFDAAVNAFTKRVENKIIFTDGCASMPSKPMDAIWIVFGNQKINPKGGRVIYISDEMLRKLEGNTSYQKTYRR